MDQATVQKLNRAIATLVQAEIAWHDALNDPRGQRDEHRPVLDKVLRARRTVQRFLQREFDADTYEKMVVAHRRAHVDTTPKATDFDAVPEE